MRPTKDKMIGVRLTEEQYQFIEDLANEDEITMQEVLRKLIKKVMSVG